MALVQQIEQTITAPRKSVVVRQPVFTDEDDHYNDEPRAVYGFLSAFLLAIPLWTIIILALIKLF
jgi:hypothetical protein